VTVHSRICDGDRLLAVEGLFRLRLGLDVVVRYLVRRGSQFGICVRWIGPVRLGLDRDLNVLIPADWG
jgi:hypothetical protein